MMPMSIIEPLFSGRAFDFLRNVPLVKRALFLSCTSLTKCTQLFFDIVLPNHATIVTFEVFSFCVDLDFNLYMFSFRKIAISKYPSLINPTDK